MASISKKIEDFAKEKLNSVLEVIPSGDSAATETATPEAHNVCLMLSFLSDIFMLIFWTDCNFADWVSLYFLKDGVLENLSASVADAQTLMSLYFALCTKVNDYWFAAILV